MSILLVSNGFLKIVTSNNWRKFSRDHFWNRKIFLWTNKVTQIENFCCVAPTGHNLTVALVKGHYYCTVYISGGDKPGGPVTQQKFSDRERVVSPAVPGGEVPQPQSLLQTWQMSPGHSRHQAPHQQLAQTHNCHLSVCLFRQGRWQAGEGAGGDAGELSDQVVGRARLNGGNIWRPSSGLPLVALVS